MADAEVDFDRRWTRALALRWGGDIPASVAAYLASASYAKATNGVIFDFSEGAIITASRAGAIAGEIEQAAPDIKRVVEDAVRRMQKF